MSEKRSAVDRPISVTVIFSLLVLLGGYLALKLDIALYPEIKPPYVAVMAIYPNAGPTTVESNVTKILEASLSDIGGIKKMTSTSSSGVSMIEMQFDYAKNLTAATNDVRDRLSAVLTDLPKGVKAPQIFTYNPNSSPILQIAVRSARTAEETRKIAVDSIAKEFLRIDGVTGVSVSGGKASVVRVDVSQERLDAYGLTLSGVSGALAAQSLNIGGGRISENGKNFSVRTTGEFKNIDEIASSVVAIRNGYGVKLGDIATVKLDYKDEDSCVIINGEPGIYISIKKQSGGNTVKIATEVKKTLPDIQVKLPRDVRLEIVSDDTKQISETVRTLVRSAIEAILFAMLVIFLFLRSARTTIIIGLSIPISIATTFLAMYFMGISLNIFTMTGLILGVGMIVDDSIVIMENIVRYRERGMKSRIAANIGSGEMKNAVIASTLTTVFVFVPFLIFKNKLDIIGILFQDMLVTIIISLLSSLAVALFLVPVLIGHYFPLAIRAPVSDGNPLILADGVLKKGYEKLSGFYGNMLRVVMNHRMVVLLTVAVALVLSIALVGSLKFTFAPETAQVEVSLNVELPVGTSIEETKKVLNKLNAIVNSEAKGVASVILTAGGGGSGDDSSASDSHKGSIQVVLPQKEKQIDGSERIKSIFRNHYGDFPGAKFSFSSDESDQLSGTSGDVDIKLSSDDLNAAINTAQKITDIIKAKVPEILEVSSSMNTGLPQVEISVDRKKASSMGIDVSAVANEVNACIAGVISTQFHQSGSDYDILVVLREHDRQKIPDLSKIFIAGNSGSRVALSNIASLTKGTGPLSIERQNKSRVIHITVSAKPGTSIPELERQIKKAVNDNIIPSPMVRISYEGKMSAMVDMGKTMLVIIVMAIILIFGVMAAQYESYLDPLINLFTIPLMIIGVVLIYWVTGQAITMFTALGLLMLVGIVVKNGIVMVDYTNLLRRRGVPVKEACVEAGVTRLRPVLMTSLTAILGMIPLAFGSGQGGELVQPIGLTVIGGLTSSTLMTLFLIPVIYSIFNKDKKGERNEEA